MSKLFRKVLLEKERLITLLDLEKERVQRLINKANYYESKYNAIKNEAEKYKRLYEIAIGDNERVVNKIYKLEQDVEKYQDSYSRLLYPDNTGQ